MDFDKLKPAVEEIKLSDLQRQKILDACKEKKRKFNYKPLIAFAAVFAVVIVLCSPGFMFKAGSSDLMANENSFDLYAKEDALVDGMGNAESTQEITEFYIFEAEGFEAAYSFIPVEFTRLVGKEDFEEWKAHTTAKGGMALMQFIEYFGISRLDFEKANEEYILRTGMNHFDGDVIFTFDKKSVDNFYEER